jgi:hypothetical protein
MPRDTELRCVMLSLRLKVLHEKLWDLLDKCDEGRTSPAESSVIESMHAKRMALPVYNDYRFSVAEIREISDMHRRLCR